MFSLMGNCISCPKISRRPKQEITLAVLGLDSAGKTTATKGLVGEPVDPAEAPTVGFSSSKFRYRQFEVTLFDLGGGTKIRGIWRNYFAEVHGIIYVVDSTASARMQEVRDNLHYLLEHPQVTAKPLLLLANKQDHPDALDEIDICEQLSLENVVNVNKCPCRIETCSALTKDRKKLDPNIWEGLDWLILFIERHLDKLQQRVLQDMSAEAEKQKAEREARKERVRLQREEREKKEAEERERMGIVEQDEEEKEIDGDPFKTLNIQELEAKEKKAKEEKAKRKELAKMAAEKLTEEGNGDFKSANENLPMSDRRVNNNPALGDYSHNNSDLHTSQHSRQNGEVKSFLSGDSKAHLSPLTPMAEETKVKLLKKKKKKKPQPDTADQEVVGDVLGMSVGNKSLRTISQIEMEEAFSMGNGDGKRTADLTDNASNQKTSKSLGPSRPLPVPQRFRKLPELSSPSNLQGLRTPFPQQQFSPTWPMGDGGESEDKMALVSNLAKPKKKKSRLKKNQLAPMDENQSPGKSANRDSPIPPLALNSVSPRSNVAIWSAGSPGRLQSNGLGSQQWGMVEDLPEVMVEPVRLRPNYDDDDDIMM